MYTYIYMYIHKDIHIHIHIRIYAHIHTHTHTHIYAALCRVALCWHLYFCTSKASKLRTILLLYIYRRLTREYCANFFFHILLFSIFFGI